MNKQTMFIVCNENCQNIIECHENNRLRVNRVLECNDKCEKIRRMGKLTIKA